MSEIQNIFEFFEKKENIETFLKTEKEKAIFRSVSFMKKNLKNFIKNNKLECNHSIEDICAFFENNLSETEKEQIKDKIFSCDNCFDTYNYLKTQIKLEKVQTPDTILNKVLVNDTSFLFLLKKIFLETFDSFRKSNLKLALGSSFAVIIVVMFSLPMFLSKKDFDTMPTQTAKINEEFAEKDKFAFDNDEIKGGNNNTPSDKKETSKKSKPQEQPMLSTSIVRLSKTPPKPQPIQIQTQKNQVALSFDKVLPQKEKKQNIEKKYSDTIVNVNNLSKRILEPKKDVQGDLKEKPSGLVGSGKADVNIEKPLKQRFAMSSKALQKEENKDRFEDKIAMNEPKNKDKMIETKDRELSKSEPKKDNIVDFLEKKIFTVAPAVMTQSKTQLADSDIKQEEAKTAKSKSQNKLIFNDISLEKDGFIVIYEKNEEKLGKILVISQYLTKGFYKNIEIYSENDIKKTKFIAILYYDSNNNKKFDITDTIIKNINF